MSVVAKFSLETLNFVRDLEFIQLFHLCAIYVFFTNDGTGFLFKNTKNADLSTKIDKFQHDLIYWGFITCLQKKVDFFSLIVFTS